LCFQQCLTAFNKPSEQNSKAVRIMASQMELIKAQVLNRVADTAEPFVQVKAMARPAE
jgi:hypothetical protein